MLNIGTIGHFKPTMSLIAISVKMVLGSEFTGP